MKPTKPQLVEIPNRDIMSVWDGHMTIAKAHKTGYGVWVCVLYRGAWLNPKARNNSTATGKVDPKYMVFTRRAEVKKELELLFNQVMMGK